MSRLPIKPLFVKASLALIIIGSFIVIGAQPAQAATGFLNLSRGGHSDNGTRYGVGGDVINGGVPNWVNSIPSLMSYLRSKYNEAPGGNFIAPHKNQAGVATFVRLLLGDGRSYIVTPADFDRLERLLQPSNGVTIAWNQMVTGGTHNTTSCQHRIPIPGANPYDVCRITESWSGNSIVISQITNSGSLNMGIIQRACLNPDGNTRFALVERPQDYNLTPNTTSGGSSRVVTEAGGTIPAIGYGVGKTGAAVNSRATNWQLARCTYLAGYLPRSNYEQAAPDNSSNAVVTYTARGGTCNQADAGFSRIFSGSGSSLGVLRNLNTGSAPVGSRICYVLSVSPPNHTAATNVWRHSTPFCVVVAKQPKVQILGGDLRTAGDANASISTKDISGVQRTFGSWVEYGIFAGGRVTNFASASALASPGQAGSESCSPTASLSRASLSFTNSVSSSANCLSTTTIGSYSSIRALPDIASVFPATNAPRLASNDLANQSRQGVFTLDPNTTSFNLAGGTIQSGRWVVLNAPNATVTITGNITYSSAALSTIANIPQVVIIARNIIVADSVTQIDAWLVARSPDGINDGKLITCSSAGETTPLTAAMCTSPLTVNGPVVATKIFLGRTAGSTTGPVGSAEPAETFNLRPDAYMWAYQISSTNGRVQTVYTTELPPRL